MQRINIFLAAVLVAVCQSHMQLDFPPPFRGVKNPNVPSGTGDYSMTSPLKADGSDFPCKGYQKDLGTPAGASVVTWAAGASANFSVSGGAFHNGGSCQASLSFDKGASFTVIHSYVGNCPTASGGSFDFSIPSDAPAGEAIFAWSWLNQVGNREYYMNCAAVTIEASKRKRSTTTFTSRPGLFVANLNNGCTSIEGTDLVFPDPGPDVTDNSQKHGEFVGTCKSVNGIGTTTGSSSSPANSSDSNTASQYLGSSATQSSRFVTSYIPSASTATSSSSIPNSSIAGSTLSNDGSCLGTNTCNGSPHGPCCSSFGWCGATSQHCELALGCNPTRGTCGMNGTDPSVLSSSSVSGSSNSLSTFSTSIESQSVAKTATVVSTTTITITDGGSAVTIIPVSQTAQG